GMENAHLSNFNIIPLVALILATPRITPERSVKILAVGIFLLFCLHVTDFVSHFPMYFRDSGIAALVGLLGHYRHACDYEKKVTYTQHLQKLRFFIGRTN
ncbi:hypothetical protein KA005_22330, partial [bacterium]|nr:hypothetical protein [bacterium]